MHTHTNTVFLYTKGATLYTLYGCCFNFLNYVIYLVGPSVSVLKDLFYVSKDYIAFQWNRLMEWHVPYALGGSTRSLTWSLLVFMVCKFYHEHSCWCILACVSMFLRMFLAYRECIFYILVHIT